MDEADQRNGWPDNRGDLANRYAASLKDCYDATLHEILDAVHEVLALADTATPGRDDEVVLAPALQAALSHADYSCCRRRRRADEFVDCRPVCHDIKYGFGERL